METQTARRLKMLGIILFLLGMITGLIIPALKNPHMGLAAHLSAIMNGMFLVLAGFLWAELKLPAGLRKILFGVLLFGTYFNWVMSVLAAIWGTSRLTPLSGNGFSGTAMQEDIVAAGLYVLVLAMLFSASVIVYGLRGKLE